MQFQVISALVHVLISVQVVRSNIINQCNQNGMFAMTFDDGPGTYTGQLLDILAQKSVKATFHLTTKYLTDPNVQATVQRIASAGHLIGLRTEASWNLLTMSDDQIRSSIARQANVMASFIGYYPKFVRLPYNGYDDRVVKAVESTGAVITIHNLESYDYTNDSKRISNAFQLSMSLVSSGDTSFISVQHDSIQQSVAITPSLIDMVTGNGFKVVTLDSCLGMSDMTKNKNPLKGGSGPSLPLGNPSSGGGNSSGSPKGAGSIPSGPNVGSTGGIGNIGGNNGISGQDANKKNEASTEKSSSLLVTLAICFSIIISLVF